MERNEDIWNYLPTRANQFNPLHKQIFKLVVSGNFFLFFSVSILGLNSIKKLELPKKAVQ